MARFLTQYARESKTKKGPTSALSPISLATTVFRPLQEFLFFYLSTYIYIL